jgi:8-oxo-dGTP pyrophosphatase MutT (NUDIX family)
VTDAAETSATDELHDDAVSFEITSSERVFDGKIWDIRRETFAYGDAEITREFVDHTGAVAVLAIDDEDRVLLIKQYRHPVRMREWEIPAGLLDVTDEPPLAAVRRELAEEADLQAAEWSVLAEYYTTPGGSDEAIRVYLARGLTPTAEAFARTDEEADIETRWVDLDEVVTAVLERRIQNPSTVIAVLQAHVARSRGWTTLGPADAPWPRHPKLRDGGGASGS